MSFFAQKLKVGAALVYALGTVVPVQAARAAQTPSPFQIYIPPQAGEITQAYIPRAGSRPDFIVIQSVHSNPAVQYAISNILKQLKTQGLVPDRIAIEGGKGPIDIHTMQRNSDSDARRRAADYLVSLGELTGAAHFVVAEGAGDLYGAENPELYQASVDTFRRSYASRMRLSKNLESLDASLALLQRDPSASPQVSVLSQDVQVIQHLVNMRLIPEEVHQVTNRAVFAVDHLAAVMTGETKQQILEPVSAAVNFYALALLRDDALFTRSLELRESDRQRTSIMIAGGFHTTGLTQRLSHQGYSYVVVTPRVKFQSEDGERLYIQRLLGYHVSPAEVARASTVSKPVPPAANRTAWAAAHELQDKLKKIRFSIPPIRDIFTAMDRSGFRPPVQTALLKQRARILNSVQPLALRLEGIPATQ